MKILRKINQWTNRVLIVIGGAAIMLLMLVATGNVFLRVLSGVFPGVFENKESLFSELVGLFNAGTFEVVGFLGAVVIAFALGETQRRKDHIMVEIFTKKFPPLLIKILDGTKYFICMIFFAIVAVMVFKWGLKIRRTGEVSETLKIIFDPFIYLVSLGFLALTFTLLVDFLDLFFKTESASEEAKS